MILFCVLHLVEEKKKLYLSYLRTNIKDPVFSKSKESHLFKLSQIQRFKRSDWNAIRTVPSGETQLRLFRYPPREVTLSNHAVLQLIYEAINHQQNRLLDSHILLLKDNRTVVSYMTKEGGTKSKALLDLTRKILLIMDQLNIHITGQYFPGHYNTEVDVLSRIKPSPEWHLLPLATRKIFQIWGTPEIYLWILDISTSETNTTDPISPEHRQRKIHSNSTQVGESVLVSRSTSPFGSHISHRTFYKCFTIKLQDAINRTYQKNTITSLGDFG
ncbi:unnamed protein product [Euphydryas editha]|uniref:Uncharacterized protein n=1 Tax=Euphydryas editha TaxID=104508 RepID=A0AAU9TIF3_EUPED|nr:unnamed protein product [Euphydryas editha]